MPPLSVDFFSGSLLELNNPALAKLELPLVGICPPEGVTTVGFLSVAAWLNSPPLSVEDLFPNRLELLFSLLMPGLELLDT